MSSLSHTSQIIIFQLYFSDQPIFKKQIPYTHATECIIKYNKLYLGQTQLLLPYYYYHLYRRDSNPEPLNSWTKPS